MCIRMHCKCTCHPYACIHAHTHAHTHTHTPVLKGASAVEVYDGGVVLVGHMLDMWKAPISG